MVSKPNLRRFVEDRACISEDMLADRQTRSSQWSAPVQRDICPVPVNLPSAFKKHFCPAARSLTLSLIPGKLFPTSSGS